MSSRTWLRVEDADPRELYLAYINGQPQFVAWARVSEKVGEEWVGVCWPFRHRRPIRRMVTAWRVVCPDRDGGWGVLGNYGPLLNLQFVAKIPRKLTA